MTAAFSNLTGVRPLGPIGLVWAIFFFEQSLFSPPNSAMMCQLQLFRRTPCTSGFSVDKTKGHKYGFDLAETSCRLANKDEDPKMMIMEDEEQIINNKRDTKYIHLFDDRVADNFLINIVNTAQVLEDVMDLNNSADREIDRLVAGKHKLDLKAAAANSAQAGSAAYALLRNRGFPLSFSPKTTLLLDVASTRWLRYSNVRIRGGNWFFLYSTTLIQLTFVNKQGVLKKLLQDVKKKKRKKDLVVR
ncbi:hypothetical protein LguiB_013739 [Lonicera macranthoides]